MIVKSIAVGCTIAASGAISPKCDTPISTTAASCSGSTRNSVSGTPSWLLKFFSVFSTFQRCDSTDATISFAVVLPTLPVTPSTGMEKRARYAAASVSSAAAVSGTTMTGRVSPAGTRMARQQAAPASNALAI